MDTYLELAQQATADTRKAIAAHCATIRPDDSQRDDELECYVEWFIALRHRA